MTPPPAPAVVVAGGLALNLGRSYRNRQRQAQGLPTKPTICRWACTHKRTAITVAAGGSTWLLAHLALYVIELPDP